MRPNARIATLRGRRSRNRHPQLAVIRRRFTDGNWWRVNAAEKLPAGVKNIAESEFRTLIGTALTDLCRESNGNTNAAPNGRFEAKKNNGTNVIAEEEQ